MFNLKKCCFFTFLLVFGLQCLAVEANIKIKKVPATLIVDTARVIVGHFNNAAIKAYLKDPDFHYNAKVYDGLSWWTVFWLWVWHAITSFFAHLFGGAVTSRVFGYMVVGLAAAFLIFIIFKFLGIDIIRFFRRESAKVDIPYTELPENIHQIDFDNEIESAIANKNFRMAVRLLYLRCLKQLADNDLIQWQIEKTNSAYVDELQDAGKKQFFGQLTMRFEYIWYGDFPLDVNSFQTINIQFQEFKRQLR